jgi:hypothetical protein
MRKNLLLIVLAFSLVFFFSKLGFAQHDSIYLQPVALNIHPCIGGGTVEIDIMIKTLNPKIVSVQVPLFVGGTATPVLNCVLTGGIGGPPCIDPPPGMNGSLVAAFSSKIVNELMLNIPPPNPLMFAAIDFGNGIAVPSEGLYCKMFYDVADAGTITFSTGYFSPSGLLGMNADTGAITTVTWGGPYSFDVVRTPEQAPVVECDKGLNNFVGKTVDINIKAKDAGGTDILPGDPAVVIDPTCGGGDFEEVAPPAGWDRAWIYHWNTADVPACVAGPHTLTFTVSDECASTDCITDVNLIATVGFVQIGVVEGAPCDVVSVPVQIQPNDTFGAFNFYIEFDPTVLYFLGVEKGPGLPQGWELFTYRQLPCPMCGCCKYKLQLFGLADIKNMTKGVPIAPNPDFITIAYLKFKIACDQNLRGTEPNICFEWDDEICTENTLSDTTGNKLYVSDNEDFYGPPCPAADDATIIAKVTFVLRSQGDLPGTKPCGGVLIGEAAEYARGDINLNGIAYDPADLTLFSNALIYGADVAFTINKSIQLAKSDINADGFVLSLSDFVYMLRVMLSDATKFPKPTPGSDLATIYVTQGTVSTNATLGAALLTFKGEGKVSSNLTFEQGVVDGNLRVLVYMNSGAGLTGELLTVSGATLEKVEAVDNFGRPVKTTLVNKVIPTAFALYANYPNPFNPTTNISFALPVDSKVSLKLYNVAGQLVRTLVNETMPAGTHTVTWDGNNSNGEKVASGIYFYKLNAGDFSKTMKMVMTK